MNFKCALITGASSGIGLATARGLAAQGLELILVARRKDRLQKVKSEIESQFGVPVNIVDVDLQRTSALATKIAQIDLGKIDLLINNAGLARGVDKLQDADPSDWDAMIDTNVKALLALTRIVLPHMLKRKFGHIVNVGSVAGRWVYPGGAVYCATKFAVRAISEGLRMDLMGTPIRVTNIEPGMVETEFSEVRLGDKERAKSVYRGMTPLTPEDIAECIVWSVQRPQHVNIQEMVIFPTDQAGIQHVHRA